MIEMEVLKGKRACLKGSKFVNFSSKKLVIVIVNFMERVWPG
jgi:hypothetical protein